MRVMAMVWIALFRARSQPRLSRCRTVLPCWPAMGWGPTARRRRRRFGTVQGGRKTRWLELGDRADAAALGQPGSDLVNDGLQLSPVGR